MELNSQSGLPVLQFNHHNTGIIFILAGNTLPGFMLFFLRIFLLICCLAAGFNVTANTGLLPADTTNAGALYRQGDALARSGSDSAIYYYKQALSQYMAAQAWVKSVTCYNRMGSFYYHQQRFTDALDAARKALALSNHIKEPHLQVADSYAIVAEVLLYQGQLDTPLVYFEKSLAITRNVLGENNRLTARKYWSIGAIIRNNGENERSLIYFKKALDIFLRFNQKYDKDVADVYRATALSYYYLYDYEKALQYAEQAGAIYRVTEGELSILMGETYNLIGLIYAGMSKYDEALKRYQLAVTIFDTMFHGQHPYPLMFYRNIGDAYSSNGKYADAVRSYLKAVAIGERILGVVHPAVAVSYNDLAKVHITMGDYKQAYLYAEKAITANGVIPWTSPDQHHAVSRYMDIQGMINSLYYAGLTLHKINLRLGNVEGLKHGLQMYNRCDTLVDVMRKSMRGRTDKLIMSATVGALYENAIQAYIQLYDLAKQPRDLEMAFSYSEKNKALLLADALSEVKARQGGGVPEDMLELEKKLKSEQSRLESKATQQKNNSGSISDTLNDKLFAASRRYDSLLKAMEEHYPKYYRIKYRDRLASLEDIQHALEPDAAWIQYFLGDSIAYAFTITKQEVKCIPIQGVQEITRLMKDLRMSLDPLNNKVSSLEQFRRFVKHSYVLYQKIVAQPVKQLPNAKKLTIIPDGQLGYIPFEILLTAQEDSSHVHYSDLSYLLNRYRISYGYSATLLLNQQFTERKKNTDLIAFAPIYRKEAMIAQSGDGEFRSKLTSLAWNQQEAEAIAGFMNGKAFVGNDASEKYFKRNAHRYGMIHLAMHALVDDRSPMLSKLAFTESADSVEDGFLNAYELYDMDLQAQLVVLSACETGYGKLQKGEGIMSLAHAFMYAGCPSVVMSHWLADDKATARLMELFYTNLDKGLDKDEALRQAKLIYMKEADEIRQSPAFWAGFVVLGDTRPVTPASFLEQYGIYLAIGSILLIAGAIWMVRRRKVQKSTL